MELEISKVPIAEEDKTCPICLEEIEEARVLDCLHYLCHVCSVRHSRNCFRNSGFDATCGSVFCPKCRDISFVLCQGDIPNLNISLFRTAKFQQLKLVCEELVKYTSLFSDSVETEKPGDPINLEPDLLSITSRMGELNNQEKELRKAMLEKVQEMNDEEAEEEEISSCLKNVFNTAIMRLIEEKNCLRKHHEEMWLYHHCYSFASQYFGPSFMTSFDSVWERISSNPAIFKPSGDDSDINILDLKRETFYIHALRGSSVMPDSGAVSLIQESQTVVSAELLWKLQGHGEEPLEFNWPVHASFCSGNRIAICDKNNYRIQFVDMEGKFLQHALTGQVKPRRIFEASNGHFYVCDETSSCIKVYDASFNLINRLGEGIYHCPSGIAETQSGDLIFSDCDHAFVCITNPQTGAIVKKFHTRVSGDQYIPCPYFVAVDNDDFILITDSMNNTLKIFDCRGRLSGKVSGFSCPRGLAMDHLGNAIIVNSDKNTVCLFTILGKYIQDILTAEDGLECPMSATFDHERQLLLVTQCSYYGRFSVLLYKLNYNSKMKELQDVEG